MYRIDYSNLREAFEILYQFMTFPNLTRPECTLWSTSEPLITVTNTGNGFMSEREFRKKLFSSEFAAIVCVAGTDKADKRRVALQLISGMDFLVLNFPSANDNLNKAERELLEALSARYIFIDESVT